MVKSVSKKTGSGISSLKFPRISRIIPERGVPARSFYLIVYACLALPLFLVTLEFAQNTIELNKKAAERSKIETQLAFWKDASEKYPNYRDAYFKMAVLNYQLGNKSQAKENLDKVLEIDPNFEKGRELLLRL